MANTIVSLFDNLSDAQTVASELTNQGITRSNINIIEKDSGNISSTLQSASVPADAARIYEEGVRRGGTLLTARVDDNQIDTAMDIINRHGAIDINERTA